MNASSNALDEKAALAGYTRARAILRSKSLSPMDADLLAEVRALEALLRPLAEVEDVHQAIIPLLDRMDLHSLAMLWDSAVGPRTVLNLRSRAERWMRLGAPELAMLTHIDLTTMGEDVRSRQVAARQALEDKRPQRARILTANLAALAQRHAPLAALIERCPRTWVPLSPLGAGMATQGPHGSPVIQLWALSADEAVADANQLLDTRRGATECIIAGVGDGSLPVLAARRMMDAHPWLTSGGIVHLVDPQPSRLRALMEMQDLSILVRDERLQFHVGAAAPDRLLAALEGTPPGWHEHVIGGDDMAMTVVRSVLQRLHRAA